MVSSTLIFIAPVVISTEKQIDALSMKRGLKSARSVLAWGHGMLFLPDGYPRTAGMYRSSETSRNFIDSPSRVEVSEAESLDSAEEGNSSSVKRFVVSSLNCQKVGSFLYFSDGDCV